MEETQAQPREKEKEKEERSGEVRGARVIGVGVLRARVEIWLRILRLGIFT